MLSNEDNQDTYEIPTKQVIHDEPLFEKRVRNIKDLEKLLCAEYHNLVNQPQHVHFDLLLQDTSLDADIQDMTSNPVKL